MQQLTTAHRTGGTWLVRYVTLLAAAMIMFGSETAAAGRTTPRAELRTPASTPIPASAPIATQIPASIPIPVPERRPVDDARFSGSQRETDDRITDRTDAPPTETAMIAPLVRPVVMLYGDSLAWEARHVFAQALADEPVEVIIRTFGGTAICDWHDEMTDDAATLRPGLVIIEFVGNNYTSCMQDREGEALTGAALVDRYAADAEAAIATFTSIGAQVVFAGAPIARPSTATLDLHRAPLNAVYQELARRLDGVRYVPAGESVLDDGEWTDTLPCLAFEPCAGADTDSRASITPVRAPDGLHFCPASDEATRGVTGDCPVWSSGAFRYGTALALPVLESLAVTGRSSASEA